MACKDFEQLHQVKPSVNHPDRREVRISKLKDEKGMGNPAVLLKNKINLRLESVMPADSQLLFPVFTEGFTYLSLEG